MARSRDEHRTAARREYELAAKADAEGDTTNAKVHEILADYSAEKAAGKYDIPE